MVRLAVKGAWVLENLRRLGSGAFYHLAYAKQQIHPALIQKLEQRPAHGRVHIHWLSREQTAIRFAVGEIIAIHWFPEFVRIHFMIVNVLEGEDMDDVPWEEDYILLP
mgnify:CR=1 FL=1